MSTKDVFIDSLEQRIRELNACISELKVEALALCVTVERYTRQECHRAELMARKDNLKALLK